MSTWQDLTDMFNNDAQIEEMVKKYRDCYIFVRPKNREPVLCLYRGYNDGFHRFTDMYGMEIRLLHNTETDVICVHPEKGLFNSPTRMYYFYKLPNRQYRRGVCKDNCSIIDPVYELWVPKNYFSGNLLYFAFNPHYPDIQSAMKLLRNREAASVAFTKDFGLCLSVTGNKDDLFLWYHDTMIGKIDKKDQVTIGNPHFEQEVLDNMKQFGGLEVKFNAKQ
jgi:hypothetical protein